MVQQKQQKHVFLSISLKYKDALVKGNLFKPMPVLSV